MTTQEQVVQVFLGVPGCKMQLGTEARTQALKNTAFFMGVPSVLGFPGIFLTYIFFSLSYTHREYLFY